MSAETYRRPTPPRQPPTLHRTVVSSEVFTALDNYLWKLTYKWAIHSHPNKSKHWVVDRYFGRFNKSRRDRWVFGDRDSGAAYLTKFAWTRIVRHQMVTGAASPDDPALTHYWTVRRRKGPPLPIDRTSLQLLVMQRGLCELCRGLLLHADRPPQGPREWEQWLGVTRKAITKGYVASWEDGTSGDQQLRLVHVHCHRRHLDGNGRGTALLPASLPFGLA